MLSAKTKLDRLLKKRSWTGDEAGKIVMLRSVDLFKQKLNGVENLIEPFSLDKFKVILDSLVTREQIRIYNCYTGLNNWVAQENLKATMHYARVEKRLNLLNTILLLAFAVSMCENQDADGAGLKAIKDLVKLSLNPFLPNETICNLEKYASADDYCLHNLNELKKSKKP